MSIPVLTGSSSSVLPWQGALAADLTVVSLKKHAQMLPLQQPQHGPGCPNWYVCHGLVMVLFYGILASSLREFCTCQSRNFQLVQNT